MFFFIGQSETDCPILIVRRYKCQGEGRRRKAALDDDLCEAVEGWDAELMTVLLLRVVFT